MNILGFLIPTAICLGLVFVGAFIRAVVTGQFDDLETPAHRVLLDDLQSSKPEKMK